MTSWRIPRVVIQTGRGVSAQQHNGDVAGDASTLSRQLAGRDLQYLWFNDSEARAFLASHCPQTLGAYDCLLPKPYVAASIAANPRNSRARHDRSCLCSPGQLDSLFFSSLPRACMLLPLCGYKADVFRCALWAMGGVYYCNTTPRTYFSNLWHASCARAMSSSWCATAAQ